MRLAAAVTATLAAVFGACGNGAREPLTPVTTGWIVVQVAITGEPVPGSMWVQVGTVQRGIGPNQQLGFGSLAPGAHTVRVGGVPELCRLNGEPEQVVVVAAGDTSMAVFQLTCPSAPPERLLVIVAGQLYSMTEYGTQQRALTSVGSNYFGSISPDGTRIAFTSTRDGNEEIYVMRSDGSQLVNLTNSPGTRDSWPRWSPDGTRIVFYSWRTADGPGTAEIYVVSAAGGPWQQLTANSALDADPEWSPDGRRIVFMSERDGGDQEIYVMDADGGRPQRLTNSPGLDGNPTWSPDGSRIAFATSRFGPADSYDIVVMNADGTGLVQLTSAPEIDIRPVWAPDGARIAYSHRVAQGNYDVWIINSDGSGSRLLLSGSTNEQVDDWAIIR